MLTKLLKLLEEHPGELNLEAISGRLQAQPSAVAGMIETLVRKGRLAEVGPTCGICDSCALNNQCSLPVKRARQYRLAETNRLHAQE